MNDIQQLFLAQATIDPQDPLQKEKSITILNLPKNLTVNQTKTMLLEVFQKFGTMIRIAIRYKDASNQTKITQASIQFQLSKQAEVCLLLRYIKYLNYELNIIPYTKENNMNIINEIKLN